MELKNSTYWIEKLELAVHPEGGYFRETYRSEMRLDARMLGFSGDRSVSTAIYFLLERAQCSAFHRIRSDELWHFHIGASLNIYIIQEDGILLTKRFGAQLDKGDELQVVVPAGCWFGAEVVDKTSFCLCSCTVAPGFDFNDFDLSEPDDLSTVYPAHASLIKRLGKRC